MRRAILRTLKDWKTDKKHKVLLLRGAQQVGKTYIIRELAKDFDHFLEVNFEKNPDIRHFFEQNLDPARICTMEMQSLNLFIDEKKSSSGIRISLENFRYMEKYW